jgi:CRISPR type I-E-associated protein CasB/Cse2
LGATLAEAAAGSATNLRNDTAEARLHLLCRQEVDGLHRHLPRLITHLRTGNIPVDWPELVVDLSRWGTERDFVAKRWLQDYYRTYDRITAARAAKTSESENQ